MECINIMELQLMNTIINTGSTPHLIQIDKQTSVFWSLLVFVINIILKIMNK